MYIFPKQLPQKGYNLKILIMDWDNYLYLSEKTLSTEFHCGFKVEKLLHATIGILTEMEEILDNYSEIKVLDPVNILEEIGDVTWYLAILGREYDLILPKSNIKSENPEKTIMSLIKKTLKILDFLKKKLYYNKEIDDDLFIEITNSILLDTIEYMNYYEIDIHKSFDINIEKLKERYGDKFTSDKAINRNLEKERQILEGK